MDQAQDLLSALLLQEAGVPPGDGAGTGQDRRGPGEAARGAVRGASGPEDPAARFSRVRALEPAVAILLEEVADSCKDFGVRTECALVSSMKVFDMLGFTALEKALDRLYYGDFPSVERRPDLEGSVPAQADDPD